METNYEVKPKKSLSPIKAGLLVLALVCLGLGTFAQQNTTVRVANSQEFLRALDNPSAKTMVFESPANTGYTILNSPAVWNSMKSKNGGNRSFDCIYFIQESDVCWTPDLDTLGEWYSYNNAAAGSFDFFSCGCCPPDSIGTWTWRTGAENPPPTGSNLIFLDPLNIDSIMDFAVNMPGIYTLRYSWTEPYNSFVQTEYRFYDEFEITLEADDVCGLTTDVILNIHSDYREGFDSIFYYLRNTCDDSIVEVEGPELEEFSYITGNTEQVDTFSVTAPYYGIWMLCTDIVPLFGTDTVCEPDEVCIEICFSEQPVADAGPDAEVCEDLCYSLYGTTGLEDEECPMCDYYYTWVQVSGPATLTFTSPNTKATDVCRDSQVCSYGEYEIAFTVVNGECSDADTMLLTFFEEPIANAGLDGELCFYEGCFTIFAEPYEYCSDTIGYRSHVFIIEGPQGVGISTNYPDPDDPYTLEICPTGECVFGVYTIVLWETNNGVCEDYDTAYFTLYEEPVANAGPDGSMCFYEGCFTVYAQAPVYCTDTIGERFHDFFVTDPEGSVVEYSIDPRNPYTLTICPVGECVWGEYMIVVYENNNGWCDDYDTSYFYLYEPPTADAGGDFSLCYIGGCFSMGAFPFSYCSDDRGMDERFGKWSKVGGPAAVEFTDENDPNSSACPDEEADCVYGWYTFVWTEYNGDCADSDTVEVTLYEPPTADAGADTSYCIDAEYSMMLWHTFAANAYEYCQETGFETPYGYWSKSCGPGYVTFFEEQNPNGWVHVTAFGCYCFVWTEVNGDCSDSDTIEVCFYEHPYLEGEDLADSTCSELCYNLGLLGVIPYEYLPEPNVNYNVMYWTKVAGAGEPTYTPDEFDPAAEVCVDEYGCYTFAFIQYNGDEDCADSVFADLWFFEQPEANAGADAELCGNCYMMSALPFSYVTNVCAPSEDQASYWAWFSYVPPADFCGDDGYFIQHYPMFTVIGDEWDNPEAQICVYDTYCGLHHGMYGFEWVEHNGTCEDRDTVWIDFNKQPDPLPIAGFLDEENSCGPYGNGGAERDNGCGGCWVDCLYPEDTVLTVCAYTCSQFVIDWECLCEYNANGYCPCGPIPGYTYEWSFTGPAGSYFDADPLYYDCEDNCWKGSDQIYVCFGECCDTARLYLTITTPEGCVTTEEWKFFVLHGPDATISGPEVAEVSSVFEYSIPEPENTCYLYIWEVQHCGEIVYGQGEGTIGVHWTDYNVNGGWGLVYVEVYDTCTGCCSTDSLWVKVYPQGTIGDASLSGHVYYHNNANTPLNGVDITLWNSGIPVFTTTSFNDIEGGNGVGYYEFLGINAVTEFDISATYDAPWYGANATDALAVELKVIGGLPGGFVYDDVVEQAMDVNNSNTISATDALWIKQRAISMVNYFPAGNWVYDEMSSAAGTYDIYTLNAGDANRSNIPASMKETPAIALVSDGVMNVVAGEEFSLPIRISETSQFGAITLNLGYNPALIEVVEVNAIEGMLTSIVNGNVSIAWSSVNPMMVAENDVVVTLKAKALGATTASDELFTIGLGSEFADATANVIEPVTLKTYGISTEPAAVDYFLSANRPNPFSTSTFIEYTLPETGKVKLSVLDMLGQEIAVLVESTQTAGSYTVEFGNPGLATGVYIYKITVDGETRDYVSTQRMVISH